jgi:putative multiple sugar transport system permease protein
MKKEKTSFFAGSSAAIKESIRNYAMYAALAIIFIVFGITTSGSFLTARNLTNLINQTGYVAVMAVGMTLVLILTQIDLSIGSIAGFFGAVAGLLLMNKVNVLLVILILLIGGVLAGLLQGIVTGKVGVPAFVTTLAGLFIFRGLVMLVTEATGTIPVSNDLFNSISNGFLPPLFTIGGRHGLTLFVGLLAVLVLFITQINHRRDMISYKFKVTSLPVFIMKNFFFALLIGSLTFVLSGYRGISWTIVVVAIVTIVYHLMLTKTRLGRHIYGVGGNKEAALLAGVNVRSIIIFSFASMGLMASLGGILFTSRLQSATPTAGNGFELDTIAACFIGGVSTTGGIGRVTNSIIGAFVIISLTNGLNLMSIGISYQYIIKGIIFIFAVALDVRSRGKRAI